jgi:transposase
MLISAKIGCEPQTLSEWVKKAEVSSGRRAGIPSEMIEKLKVLESEIRELRQANDPHGGGDEKEPRD